MFLRSIENFNAGYTVLEAMSPQTGYIVIHNLHFSSIVACILKKVDFVVSTILYKKYIY